MDIYTNYYTKYSLYTLIILDALLQTYLVCVYRQCRTPNISLYLV